MTCTKERFLRDVASHVVEVIRDDGVNRHIRFRKPDTMCFHFDLITWPGYLCYTGDMGTFVFRRLTDMFEFFRTKPYKDRDPLDQIDRRYWAEKLEATDKNGGHVEFDKEAFQREITVQRRKLLLEHGRDMPKGERESLCASLEEVKDAADEGKEQAYVAVQEWVYHQGPYNDTTRIYLDTDDFPDYKTYTFSFRWCCFALAWGIQQYDKAKGPTT